MGVRSSWCSIWNPAILEIGHRGITILEIFMRMYHSVIASRCSRIFHLVSRCDIKMIILRNYFDVNVENVEFL